MKLAAAQVSVPAITLIPKDCCPRCYLQSQRKLEIRLEVRFCEHMHILHCNHCHYEAKESSSAMRVAFIEAQRYAYLDPRRGTIRIMRTK